MKRIHITILCLCSCAILCAGNPYLPYMRTATDSIALLIDRESKLRYGYQNFCTENELILYKQVIDSFCTFQANGAANGWIDNRAYFYPVDAGAANPGIYGIMNLINRMLRDMPELYIFDSYIPRSVGYSGYYIRLHKSYTPSLLAAELAAIDDIVSGIVEKTEMLSSDYEKVILLHDTLCRITCYGDMSGADAGNIKGVFLNNRAVCEGWARAFLYLCQKTGIRCLYIEGGYNLKPDEDTPTWGNHAWNHVEVDGQWYLVDATTDGALAGALGNVGHRAFLKGQDHFDKNYRYISLSGENESNENTIAYPTLPTLAPTDYVPTMKTYPCD